MAVTTPTTLKLEPRVDGSGKNLRALRRKGRLPGIVYGHGVDAFPITVDGRELIRAFQKVGRNQLVDLEVGEDAPRKALIRELQRSPRSGDLLHVDFYQVNLLEEIESEVPLEFEGEVEIIAKGEADLQHGLHQLRIRCLPTDLPPTILVDISGLKEVDDEIRVKDLKLPPKVEVLDEPEDLIVKIAAHRAEEEEAPAAPPAAAEVPTVGETQAPAEGTGEAPEG